MRQYRTMAALMAGAALVSAMSLGVAPAGAAQRPQGGSARSQGYPVAVYFSRHPASDNRYGAVFAVRRVSPTRGVATFAVRQLLAGPTAAEARAGYFTELTQAIRGPSTCGPAGFTLRLNRRGRTPEPGTATLQFCRRLSIPSLGADARMSAEIVATLRQFPPVHRVVILTAAGVCFGDLSGLNRCLRPR